MPGVPEAGLQLAADLAGVVLSRHVRCAPERDANGVGALLHAVVDGVDLLQRVWAAAERLERHFGVVVGLTDLQPGAVVVAELGLR